MIKKWLRTFLITLITAVLVCPISVAANTTNKTLNDAVERYYAGETDAAIGMIEPLALSGEVEAQYLLGNILYSLSQAGQSYGDPVEWYRMAAEQNFVEAIFALGALFHNRWLETRDRNDAANAIVYYQRAVDLGSTKAQQPLRRLQHKSELSLQQALIIVEQQEPTPTPVVEPVVAVTSAPEPASAKEATPEPIETIIASAETEVSTESEAPIVTEAPTETAASEETIEPPADEAAPIEEDEPAITVTLAEIVDHCRTYTETGFNLFVDSIVGATLTGKTTAGTAQADSSNPGSYTISWTNKNEDLSVTLNMRGIPGAVTQKTKAGNEYKISATVVDSKVVGSDCSLQVTYLSIN